ncbi:hypothetical protein [Candidatus Magnetaquiglobus chichijimensis]|uniref:hypothetical protein n=1 Tax=Candidatus Magnetaquiglobus chichijimensis TaxID=3141448 RepID=UPI003B9749C0
MLFDAVDITKSYSINYQEDLRWLFRQKLLDILELNGEPIVRTPLPKLVKTSNSILFPGRHLIYQTGGKLPPEEIDAQFCLKYGFDIYSVKAINYRHLRKEFLEPLDFVSDGPCSIGNFAVAFDRPPVGYVSVLPGDVAVCGMAEIPYGKTRSIQAWLGVWFVRERIQCGIIEKLEQLPFLHKDRFQRNPESFFSSLYYSKFMQYNGISGENEQELRQRLGFKPIGSIGVSEEIMYRSLCNIFGKEHATRRYRGKELDGLEIDVWIPSRKLGFEYQGEQHFRQIDHWHGDECFKHQRARDEKKKRLCKKLGYRIIHLTPKDDLSREAILRTLRNLEWIDPEFASKDNEAGVNL